MTPTPAAVEAALHKLTQIDPVCYQGCKREIFEAIELLRAHQPPTDEQKGEWFYRWIARGKGGHTPMDQAIDMIWHSPDNPYAEKNPWQTKAPALPVELEGFPVEVYITKFKPEFIKTLYDDYELHSREGGWSSFEPHPDSQYKKYIRTDAQSPERVNRELLDAVKEVLIHYNDPNYSRRNIDEVMLDLAQTYASAEQLERSEP